MFPFDIDEEEIDNVEEKTIPVEYAIDFETGQLTGKKVYGLEAIKVWIWNALATPRYRYQHHTWNFGNELENLIGTTSDPEYFEASAEDMIEECLTVNSHITGITDFECESNGDEVKCIFTVQTDLGNIARVEANV